MFEKKELRKKIRLLKKDFSKEDAAYQEELIYKKLIDSIDFKNAKNILFYWSMNDEVSTHDFILSYYKIKHIYLPVIKGDDLEIVLFSGEDCLVPGAKYGIPEPTGEPLKDESIIDLVIVPGVAFDNSGNRMGRGAGYYDRILKRVPQAKRLALAFDFQMVTKVPVEPHDIKMDKIIHPK
ncbi:5-formyltetrahydrofolate cyclo-ligase [Carboxylicivirga caseinilyticus]|uniref:5-formyltetrahydrofolate cyclo-ligase n=1 Tax=Carboxylicivirga caseinilyticus TaxID=3417572 RepID=UPI003D349333|nr:5-formyltetrahydrofolate cyclo-ligase [Marinilabiliaceae bacterium A049]